MQTSETVGAIAAAMAKAQGEIRAAAKASDNPFFKSKYADLAACFDACREALSKNEVALIQSASVDENWQVTVTTMLAHKSGEWFRDTLPMPVVKKDPQGVGSSITYARRYALAAMVGLAQADDDAEGGTIHGREAAQELCNEMTAAVECQDPLMAYEIALAADDETMINAFNLFPAGKKTAFKQKWRELESAGSEQVGEIRRTICEMADKQDPAVLEQFEGFSDRMKRRLCEGLSREQLAFIKGVKEQAA